VGVGSCLAAAALLVRLGEAPEVRAQERESTRRISWADVAPMASALEAHGIDSRGFPSYVERVHAENVRRVREGDLDHLVFYVLQSTRITGAAPIEPALSAKALVDALDAGERARFLETGELAASRVSENVRDRMAAVLRVLDSTARDPRLDYFRELVKIAFPAGQRGAALLGEYLRVMRFVYQKEFVAQRSDKPATAVAELYRDRGLSTDTAVEAGYLVYLGLGVAKSLAPDHRVRRVLIVGPGLDLAPRTALRETDPPQSYQPWAVIDALIGLGLSSLDDLHVAGADINPRVVEHLRHARTDPPKLSLASEIREGGGVTFSTEFRDYFSRLGANVGMVSSAPMPTELQDGRVRKTIQVRPEAARTLGGDAIDLVTERLTGPPFDLVVATNILPYFDDVELMMAMSNVAAMLAPRGLFLHNEPRPLILEATAAFGLPFEQSRHAIIASVRGAPAPLFDSVFLHRKR
jgi:hypothetical protein